MNLYIPCGDRPILVDGWLNIDGWHDGKRKSKVDAVCDMRSLPFKNSQFDEVYCCHGIEHIPKPDHVPAIREFKRVTRRGGTVRLAVPDMEAIICVIYHSTPEWGYDHLWGDQKDAGRFHYAAFTKEILTGLMEKAGLHRIREWKPGRPRFQNEDSSNWFRALDDGKIPLSLNLEGVRL